MADSIAINSRTQGAHLRKTSTAAEGDPMERELG